MPKTHAKSESKIGEAALRCAAAQGWSNLTIEHIAKAAKISLVDLKKIFATKNDILTALVRHISAKTMAAIGKPDARAAQHDRLFEVMMARFDILQSYRRALLNIMRDVRRDPSLASHLLPAQIEAMHGMLEAAGITYGTGKQTGAALGLLVIYVFAVSVWEKDESKDMAKTMASLDRQLSWGERIAAILLRLP